MKANKTQIFDRRHLAHLHQIFPIGASLLYLIAFLAPSAHAQAAYGAYSMVRMVPMMGSMLFRGRKPHSGRSKNNNQNGNNNGGNGQTQIQGGPYGYSNPQGANYPTTGPQPGYGGTQTQGFNQGGSQGNCAHVPGPGYSAQNTANGYGTVQGQVYGANQSGFSGSNGIPQSYNAARGQTPDGIPDGMYGPTAGQ